MTRLPPALGVRMLFVLLIVGVSFHHIAFSGRIGGIHAYSFSTEISSIYVDTDFGPVEPLRLQPFSTIAGVPDVQAVGSAPAVMLVRADGTQEPLGALKARLSDRRSEILLRFVRPGDRLCPQDQACIAIARTGSFALLRDLSGLKWSFRYAKWDGGDLDYDRTPSLLADGAGEVGLIAEDNWSHTTRLAFRNGRAATHFAALKSPVLWTLPYKLLCFTLIFVLSHLVIALIQSIRAKAQSAWTLIPAFVPPVLLCALSILLWPGIFVHDYILQGSSVPNKFTSFYFSAYQVYNDMLSALGPWWHGLIPLLLWLVCVLCIAESQLSPRQKMPIFLRLLGVVAIVFALPGLTLALTGEQRHFTAVTFAFAALSLLLTLFQPTLRRPEWIYRSVLAIVFLTFAINMRADYILLVPAAAYALWSNRSTEFRRLDPGRLILRSLAIASVVTMGTTFAPQFHGYDKTQIRNEKLYLQLASLVDIVRPYVACKHGLQTELETRIGQFGPLETYCQMSPEDFFWTEGAPRIARDKAPYFEARAALFKILALRIAFNPVPFVANRIVRMRDIFYRRYWHLNHAIPTDARELNGPFKRDAARFKLIEGPGPRRDAAVALTHWLWVLSGMSFVLPLFLVYLLPALPNRRLRFTFLVTGGLLAAGCVAVALSPTGNWAYAIYLPLWTMVVVWFASAEAAARRHRERVERMRARAEAARFMRAGRY